MTEYGKTEGPYPGPFPEQQGYDQEIEGDTENTDDAVRPLLLEQGADYRIVRPRFH